MALEKSADILVVDDVPTNVLILRGMLEAEGHHVRTASSGEEAMAQVRFMSPDLILLDVMMPELDGFAVTRELKRDPITRHIPIILVTALSDHESRVQGLASGAEEFLTKPVERSELVARVRNLLRLNQMYALLGDRNRLLEHEVKTRTAQLEESYRETLYLLTRAAEFRDETTGSHIHRISDYCLEMASLLGMDAEFQRLIHYASPMHDIGKIGIPDTILLKKAPLAPQEWEVMKTHTTIGANLLAEGHSDYLQMGVEIAQHHHERWDGSGYPAGLREEAIPLPARIMSLCDAYDALRSRRPYKEPYSHERTMRVLAAGDGRTHPNHYDPALLDCFLQHGDRFAEIYQMLTIGEPGVLPQAVLM